MTNLEKLSETSPVALSSLSSRLATHWSLFDAPSTVFWQHTTDKTMVVKSLDDIGRLFSQPPSEESTQENNMNQAIPATTPAEATDMTAAEEVQQLLSQHLDALSTKMVDVFKQETIPFVNSLQEQQAAVSEKLAEVDKLAATVTKKVEVINSFEARLAAAEEAAAKATEATANTTKPAAPAKTGMRGFVDQYGMLVAQAVLMVTTVGTVIYSNRNSNAGSATGVIPGI